MFISYQHFTNIKDRKMKTSMSTSGEVSIEKNGRRENNLSTSVLVPKTEGAKVARYVVRRPYFLPYVPIQLAHRLTKENFEHNGITIKYPKSPSVERNEKRRQKVIRIHLH